MLAPRSGAQDLEPLWFAGREDPGQGITKYRLMFRRREMVELGTENLVQAEPFSHPVDERDILGPVELHDEGRRQLHERAQPRLRLAQRFLCPGSFGFLSPELSILRPKEFQFPPQGIANVAHDACAFGLFGESCPIGLAVTDPAVPRTYCDTTP